VNAPRRVFRVAGALAVLCTAALSGCSTSSTSSEPPATIGLGSDLDADRLQGAAIDSGATAGEAENIDMVMMVGDSITVGATPSLEAQFDALGLDHVIEAENGKRMAVSSSGNPSGASVTDAMVDADDHDSASEVWVVALGTNDIGQYSSPDDIAAAVNEVLAEVPDDAALVWVDTYFRDRAEQTDEVNRIIRDRVARRGNSVVAPWSDYATADGVLSGDDVHPTEDGSAWFAFVVADTVRDFLGR
jgi:lysophospholipase L1-like esterase